jgi:hypothetical protein
LSEEAVGAAVLFEPAAASFSDPAAAATFPTVLTVGCINTSPPPLLEVSCFFVQLRNTFGVQGSARALVRIVV